MSIDMDVVRTIVVGAAREELLPRFTRVERGQKPDGSIITEADLACQQRIAEQLRHHWPRIRFLGEEMDSAEQHALLQSPQPLWCLDPLDGTSNFANGIPYFSVSLALIQQGQVTLGLVYDPLRDECFVADQQGATLNGERLPPIHSDLPLPQATAIVDFKRLPPALAQRLATQPPYGSQRSFGSVALDWCWLAMGRGHVYLHGRANLWDYAAGELIFRRAGGHACTLDGEAVFVDELSARSCVGAVDAELFREWTQWLGITQRTATD